MERPNVLAVLDDCRTNGVEMNRDDVTFYVGHETIIPREGRRGIPRWQEAILAAMTRNSVRITDVLKLPYNQWWRLVARLLFDAIGQCIKLDCHGLAIAPLRGQVDSLEAWFRSSLRVLSR